MKFERVDKNRIKIRSKPQARQDFDQAKLMALADSLLAGQLQPIGVLSDYTLIWGERRLRAALLKKEITHLLAVVFDNEVTESQFLLMRATENFQREDLTDNEKWLTCKELRDANPQWQLQDLAEHLHLSPGTITKLMSPAKCSVAWREALAAGRVSIGDCYAGRKSRKGNTPSVKVTRVKCHLPSGVCIVASGAGLSLDDLIDSFGEAQKEAKKARDQGLDAKTFQSVMRDKSKKRSA